MESRFRRILLTGLAMLAPVIGPAQAADEQVIEPEIDRREIREARIDTEDFEVGVYAGAISVEDFGTNFVYGLRLDYHITESFFAEGAVGRSRAGRTSFEELSGAAELLTDSERDFTYYNVALGYNLFPGEAFIGDKWAFNTAFYLIGGAGSTTFAGDNRFTVNFGAGYKILMTDWLSFRLDVRDHVFNIDLLGEDKTTHNLEVNAGMAVFF